ncbi:CXXC-type zinc finger protein 1-like [Acanthaster planci]|uniref:CXXC-type zinc finger protein 1 n=1 Tax=Acanthaster planci TaxID=133434 RepID=A0A8B7XKS0_ACAPL|nr:CXXC-type zinc finger protein 1-like [Acanthaster planci]
MSESEGTSSSQDEIARSFHYLPERQAKVATLLSMMKKTDKEKDKEKDKETIGEESEEPIQYCICRSTDGTRFMICCDYCEEWYHGDCIGIEKEASKSIRRYACPPCTKSNPEAKTLYKEKRDSKDAVRKDKERERDKEDREKAARELLKKKKKKKKKKQKAKELEEERRKRKKEEKKKKLKKMSKGGTGSSSEREGRKATGAAARHARRCGQCGPCQLVSDCGKCDFCLDMKKYGGQNKLRQKCRLKQCIRLASKVLRKQHAPTQSDSWETTSVDTDTDSQSVFPERYTRKPPPTVDVSLVDHYDYTMRPELDPSSEKKEKREKKDKKEKQPEAKEKQKEPEKRPTKEERKRKRSQQKPALDEPKFKRVLRSHSTTGAAAEEDLPQCYGPGCVNAARPSSKYCSEACGLKLATNRLFEFLPQRIQQWQRSPCIAEENNKKSLEKMRSEMEEVKKKIAELDGKIVKLNNLIERAKKEKVAQDQDSTDGESEEADLSIFCVSCGHPINPARALRHMSKCYSKYESQTSFGSAFKTKIVGESMFCDFFNQQQNTYCKRLKVLCPEHTKEPKVSADEVCGCPLVADVFQETRGFCRVAKRKCSKHYNWEKLRRAEIDLERVRWWLKLDELLEQERNVRQAMFNRAGVLGLMLHQTLDHSLLLPPGVVPPQHQSQVKTES